MITIIFQSPDIELLKRLAALWSELDSSEDAVDEFCELLRQNVAGAYFGSPPSVH
jgi:hypothetical protein